MSEREAEIDSELSERVHAEMERWHVPGVAVGVLRGGACETSGFGVSSLETGQPVRADTLFQIGSISKVFTTTLVMRLVDDGMLDLDTPVITYLPELRLADEQAQRTATLRHLLTHSSGFYGDHFADFGPGDDALARYVASLHTLPQQTEPGELWTYNNAGFSLAGRIVEQVLGMPFEQAMRERIFTPLGLTRSLFFAHEAIVYPVAVGHTQVTPGGDKHEVARKYPLPRGVAPAGAIISTVGDLLTFAQFHMGDGTWNGQRILSEESLRAMQAAQVKAANFADAYGLGWALQNVGGTTVVQHGGSTNGFQAELQMVPSYGFVIAMLTNSGRGAALNKAVTRWALERYCGLSKPEPEQIELSTEQLERLAGAYTNPAGNINLSVRDGGLWREMRTKKLLNDNKEERQPPDLMRPTGKAEFVVVTEGENEGSRVDFILSGDGQPRYVRAGGRLFARVGQPA